MSNVFTVGEAARQIGVTPKTVRYYEEIGLLPPARRGANGYRYYRMNELDRLHFIQRAKALGLSLSEIRKLVIVAEDGRCTATQAELGRIIDDKIADCTRRIEALVIFRDRLEAAAQRLAESRENANDSCCPSGAAFAPTCGCIPKPPNQCV